MTSEQIHARIENLADDLLNLTAEIRAAMLRADETSRLDRLTGVHRACRQAHENLLEAAEIAVVVTAENE